jgi:ABC-type nitrate/sulfonate/bicarbonate transport system permease component
VNLVAEPASGRLGGALRSAIPPLLGFTGFLLAWEVTARIINGDRKIPLVPPFSSVVDAIVTDGWSYYRPNIWTTLKYALAGWVLGNLLAVLVAAPVTLFPKLESFVLQIGVTTYCLPLVAVAPIMFIAYEGTTPYVAISVLFVFFTTLVLLLSGLKSADPTSLDVVRAYGGGRFQGLIRVRLIAALPSFFAGLRIAAPAAVLGAVLAEFFQPADSGLGVGIIRSQQQLQIARTWGIAIVSTLIGTIMYMLTALVGRVVTPWAPRAEV